MTPVTLIDIRMPPDAALLGPARDWLAEVLGDLIADELVTETDAEIAELLSSELLTNAIRHAGLAPWQPICLRAGLSSPGRLRLEVTHDGPDLPLPESVEMPPLDACGGRGLAMVDALALEWGVERGDALTVWAEVTAGVPQAGPAPAAAMAAGQDAAAA